MGQRHSPRRRQPRDAPSESSASSPREEFPTPEMLKNCCLVTVGSFSTALQMRSYHRREGDIAELIHEVPVRNASPFGCILRLIDSRLFAVGNSAGPYCIYVVDMENATVKKFGGAHHHTVKQLCSVTTNESSKPLFCSYGQMEESIFLWDAEAPVPKTTEIHHPAPSNVDPDDPYADMMQNGYTEVIDYVRPQTSFYSGQAGRSFTSLAFRKSGSGFLLCGGTSCSSDREKGFVRVFDVDHGIFLRALETISFSAYDSYVPGARNLKFGSAGELWGSLKEQVVMWDLNQEARSYAQKHVVSRGAKAREDTYLQQMDCVGNFVVGMDGNGRVTVIDKRGDSLSELRQFQAHKDSVTAYSMLRMSTQGESDDSAVFLSCGYSHQKPEFVEWRIDGKILRKQVLSSEDWVHDFCEFQEAKDSQMKKTELTGDDV